MKNAMTKTLFALPIVAVAALFDQAVLAKGSIEFPVPETTFPARVLKKCMQENINNAHDGEKGWAHMSRVAMNADDYAGAFKAIKYKEDGQEVISAELGQSNGVAYMLVSASKSDPVNTGEAVSSGVVFAAATMQQLTVISSGDEEKIEKEGLESKAESMARKIRTCARHKLEM